ncbi:class I SAM-dependent methyltransferase [Hyphomicrobium sp. LHD-15]|uniref:class I SAM-dependent methyltransferase n=1 Tax=Hyphomicrobium sp. LHD-15 TaxID=3072142 RepID=UPI00280CD5BE|nr:class I SAM-dependent methyltransferase [Hyphomicrobium sp. LHD-15]MDQ8699864.1 class I SAM-dependent methyltransferase [Hyphomicrobium sp. LHD-15]
MPKTLKWLEMRVRKLMPQPVRTAYRIARSLKHVEVAQPLPPELVDGARLSPSRLHLLDLMPKRGKVAELGTLRGDFARCIFSRTEPAELHLVDIDYTEFDETGLPAPQVSRHVGFTHDVIASFPNSYFDWIYIDADHSYEGCLRDAHISADKIRPGGYMVFNDFAHIDPYLGRYGVKRAAMDFMHERRWPIAFLALDAYGLYDIALRKPDVDNDP